ncbi:MAG: MBOAT family protein [Candidatus Omnitrophica bacterium]|nr:MBOAT family protein [Candidatus Omnitrophota bacterium]
MTFNSYLFLIFFPVVVSVYFAIPQSWRWLWLLIASCCFYAAFIPAYLLILFLLIGIDYFAALLIEPAQGRWRKALLGVSIFSTCLVLFVFKYFDFFNSSAAFLAQQLGVHYSPKILSIILPIGLSFHTFQSLGYVVDVYRGKVRAERHLGIYALYVMFFPQLVAGPIERAQNLLPQLRVTHSFDVSRVTDGLRLMLWGMFKKVVIADRLALVVNQVYADPSAYAGPSLVLATIFFAFQIYCDFSGYSDIAIGSAQVLGFRLMKNFDRPYFATSIQDFWHHWHISLSTWFRDFVYIPLGGNRVSPWRWRLNILLTFLLSGLWHGANWTFIVWGALHGCYYLISTIVRKPAAWPRSLKVLITFSLVCFAWIFFRANNLSDAEYIISHLLSGWEQGLRVGTQAGAIGLPMIELLSAFGLIGFLIMVDRWEGKENIGTAVARQPAALRWFIYAACALMIMNFGVAVPIPFLYFQF